MAQQQREKPIRMTSPKGTLLFPWLNKPDTKFNPEGKYRVTLRLSEADGKALVAKLQPIEDKLVATAQKDPKRKGKRIKTHDFFKLVHDDNGDPTGEYEFSMKMTASGVRKDGTAWAMKPDLFDRHGQKLPADVAIWGGSTGKVSFDVVPYDKAIGTGISLRLNAVQVITLSEGGRSAAGYGFANEGDDDEDGDTSGTTPSDDDDDGAPEGVEGDEDY